MAAKVDVPVALNLLLFAGVAHGCTSYCGPADPTPPAQPATSTYTPAPTTPVTPTPSSYAPQPPAPIAPATDGHGHRPAGRCQVDALQLQVCASILDGLVKISLPEEREKCCRLLNGLVDIDAAACLCTLLKANVLGVPLDVTINISLSLNRCGRRDCPPGLTCPRY